MSVASGWIDVCRTGTWRNAEGRDVTFDRSRLDRIVSAYGLADPAPVLLGHPGSDCPACAWVEGLRRVGDLLQARLCLVAPSFRDAVEAGRFRKRWIELDGDRLRHLGFLGALAGEGTGRAPVRSPGGAEGKYASSAPRTRMPPADTTRHPLSWHAVFSLARAIRGRIAATHGRDAADRAIPEHGLAALEPAKGTAGQASGSDAGLGDLALFPSNDSVLDRGDTPREAPPATNDNAAAAVPGPRLVEPDRGTAPRAAAAAVDGRLIGAGEVVEGHVRAGRVLPGERSGLIALLASLPDGDDATLAFASPDGRGEMREAPASILKRFLAVLPARVDYPMRAESGAPPAAGSESDAVAAEARALVAAKAGMGLIVSPGDAVEQVRAERGLSTRETPQDVATIMDTLSPLVREGRLSVPRSGYLIKCRRGRLVVERP